MYRKLLVLFFLFALSSRATTVIKAVTPRNEQRNAFVVHALDVQFGWNLEKYGLVIPIGSVNGHWNVHFQMIDDGASVLMENLAHYKSLPPGYRIPIYVNGRDWCLHVQEIKNVDGLVIGRAHIDKGDTRGVLGVLDHFVFDSIHYCFSRDTDPR